MNIFTSAEDQKYCVQNVTIHHLIIKYMYSVEIHHANSTIVINLDENSFHDVVLVVQFCLTFFCSFFFVVVL